MTVSRHAQEKEGIQVEQCLASTSFSLSQDVSQDVSKDPSHLQRQANEPGFSKDCHESRVLR